MNFPSSYDTEALEWAEANELVVLTLNGAITDATDEMTFNEVAEVGNLNTPTYLTFSLEDTAGDFEIVKITGTATGGVCTVERGVLSSTAMTHLDDAQAVQDPVSVHFASIRTLLLGIEKYHGLVGPATGLPGTCSPGESYMDTDNDALYYAVATDTWREVNELDHSTLESSSLDDDDHAHYHNDARKLTWHTALSGIHITAAAHVHDGTGTEGLPVARFEHGLESARPGTPSYDGQVYYATDTGDLWVGNSSSWVKYSVMPTETIIMFETDCPQGWSEATAFQDKIPRGAPTGVYTGFSDSGSVNHDHDMPDVVNHTHTIQSQTGISLQSGGNHSHSKSHMGGGGIVGTTFYEGSASYHDLWFGHSDHTHSVTFPAHDTDDEGSNPATSDVDTNWPPWVKLVFCEKD